MKNLSSIRSEIKNLKQREKRDLRFDLLSEELRARVLDVVLRYRKSGRIEVRGDRIVFHDLAVEDEKVLDEACAVMGMVGKNE